MKEIQTVFYNGLAIEVEIYSAPATPPSYDSGGSPPEWDMEILSACVDDEEELSTCLGDEIPEGFDAEEYAQSHWDEIAESLD